MRVSVKTLKGSFFYVEANPADTVAGVKRIIETNQGSDVYPAERQILIHSGKVLTDESTLEDNNVSENSFLVIMVDKKKPPAQPAPAPAPQAAPPVPPAPQAPAIPAPAPAPDLVQEILNLGGGSWDQETVVRALRAADNNPDRAVGYLFTGIPEAPAPAPAGGTAPAAVPAAPEAAAVPLAGANTNPLDLFPQGIPSGGEGSNEIQELRAVFQNNPEMLQAVLQQVGRQNPELLQLIQENPDNFVDIMMNAAAGEEDDMDGDYDADGDAGEEYEEVEVTPEEEDAIERLEAMGFERGRVMEVFFACNRNEEQAANYLLDHMDD